MRLVSHLPTKMMTIMASHRPWSVSMRVRQMTFTLCVILLARYAPSAFSFSPHPHRVQQASPVANSSRYLVKSNAVEVLGNKVDSAQEKQRVAVLVCPAQFCVPADYNTLFETLEKSMSQSQEGNAPTLGTFRVAPLPRTEWIKVARNLPTRSFVDATLPVHSTLAWYFEAIENALSDIFAQEGPDTSVSIIGHSIGGWVARAYLGGLSGSSTAVCQLAHKRCSSLITLGTPHSSPDDALVDQTRGLLKEIEQSESCSSQSLVDRGVDVTCVGSSGLEGKILSSNVEELVAASSYFPLLGRLGVKGDGIVPSHLAFMDPPARRIEVERCNISGGPVRHAHVLPTPWNLIDGSAPSISLPKDFSWYGSEGVVETWSSYIR